MNVRALNVFLVETKTHASASQAIQAFRQGRSPPGDRRILKSVITTYGPDFAVPHLICRDKQAVGLVLSGIATGHVHFRPGGKC